MVYSRSHPEDIASDAEGHCVDALRYGLTRSKLGFTKVRVTGI
jgi:hypothetical protein